MSSVIDPYIESIRARAKAESEIAAADSMAEPTKAMFRALVYGNEKHGPGNWKHWPDARVRLAEKIVRHLIRYLAAPSAPDVDSGLPHLAHVLADAALLYETARYMGHILEPNTQGRLNQ